MEIYSLTIQINNKPALIQMILDKPLPEPNGHTEIHAYDLIWQFSLNGF